MIKGSSRKTKSQIYLLEMKNIIFKVKHLKVEFNKGLDVTEQENLN